VKGTQIEYNGKDVEKYSKNKLIQKRIFSQSWDNTGHSVQRKRNSRNTKN
jgi:hypothetical protein